jgi:hypothetical protein
MRGKSPCTGNGQRCADLKVFQHYSEIGFFMEDNIKRKIEEMYNNINNRSVELVFYGNRLKKSIGQRKPTSDL